MTTTTDPQAMFHAIKRAHGAKDEAFVTLGGKACFTSTWNLARWLCLVATGKPIDVEGAHAACKRVAAFQPGQDPGTDIVDLSPEAALDWMAKLCPPSE